MPSPVVMYGMRSAGVLTLPGSLIPVSLTTVAATDPVPNITTTAPTVIATDRSRR